MSEISEKCAVNPYLPGWEYVPDGEPHVFGDRVYVYGSHDRAGGTLFCERDYVVWSAPVDSLSEWRFEGVSYRKEQDPHNVDGAKELWAPDVCRGSDGRYYLYYCLAFVPEIGVAVSEKPEGPFAFYHHVCRADGSVWDADLPFDPAVLYEDTEHIWLYTGFGCDPVRDEENPLLAHPSDFCSCLRLAPDMYTVLADTPVLPTHHCEEGTEFAGHAFFEASSIRKINGLYYLVYSSFLSHELCYATSRHPDRDFVYRGTLISNADIGYLGNAAPRAYYANNHGGLVQIRDKWYIFYHRHTNLTHFSRQGCAEAVEILPDGSIPQAEMTSCGLNRGPLPAAREYSAHICCNLMGPDGAGAVELSGMPKNTPFLTEEHTGEAAVNQYVRNLRGGAVCGVKYLRFEGENCVRLRVRGEGRMELRVDSENSAGICTAAVHGTAELCDDGERGHGAAWQWTEAEFEPLRGVHAIYFCAVGADSEIDFSDFEFCVRSGD